MGLPSQGRGRGRPWGQQGFSRDRLLQACSLCSKPGRQQNHVCKGPSPNVATEEPRVRGEPQAELMERAVILPGDGDEIATAGGQGPAWALQPLGSGEEDWPLRPVGGTHEGVLCSVKSCGAEQRVPGGAVQGQQREGLGRRGPGTAVWKQSLCVDRRSRAVG